MLPGRDLLVSDAERDEVAAELREHYEVGRLTHDELSHRLDVVHRARHRSELRRLVRDLPRIAVRRPKRKRRARKVVLAAVGAVLLMLTGAVLVDVPDELVAALVDEVGD